MELVVSAPPAPIVPPPSTPVKVKSPTCALPPVETVSVVAPLPLRVTGPYTPPLPPLVDNVPATLIVDCVIAPGEEPTFRVAPAETPVPPAPVMPVTPFTPAVTL